MKKLLHLISLFLRPAGLDFGLMTGSIVGSGMAAQSPKPTWQAPDYTTARANEMWLQAMQAIQSATDRNTGMVDPVLLQSYSQMLGIDLTPMITSGAAAGGQYSQLAGQAGQAGQNMMGAGSSILNTAFDPQGALYERGRQQTVDQTRGAESARGVAMGGYGAGVEGDQLRNYNIDWQNQQLNRQMAGAGAAQGAYSAGLGYGAQQPQYTQMGAQTPIAAQQQVAGMPMNYANQFLGAEQQLYQPYQNMLQPAQQYAAYGTNAQYNRAQQDMAAQYQQFNQWMQSQEMAGQSGAGKPENWVFGGMGGMGGMGGGGGGAPGAGPMG